MFKLRLRISISQSVAMVQKDVCHVMITKPVNSLS